MCVNEPRILGYVRNRGEGREEKGRETSHGLIIDMYIYPFLLYSTQLNSTQLNSTQLARRQK